MILSCTEGLPTGPADSLLKALDVWLLLLFLLP